MVMAVSVSIPRVTASIGWYTKRPLTTALIWWTQGTRGLHFQGVLGKGIPKPCTLKPVSSRQYNADHSSKHR